MGAWGCGVFENDTACDFAAAVADGGGFPLVDRALSRVLARGADYLEALEAEEGLAAAEIVARMNDGGGSRTSYTETVDAWIAASRVVVPPKRRELAKRAVARVLCDPSEIVELWTESEQADRWRRSVETLLARL
jgi:hypothetical protein